MASEIVGYVWDDKRKRYFRITNGDQRINRLYSNNRNQAQKRRRDIEKRESDQRREHDGNKTKNTRKISAAASMEMYRAEHMPRGHQILFNTRMGTFKLLQGWPLVMQLMRCTKMVKLMDSPVWLLRDKKHVVRAQRDLLSFYDAALFGHDPLCSPKTEMIMGLNDQVRDFQMDSIIFTVSFEDNSIHLHALCARDFETCFTSTYDDEPPVRFLMNDLELQTLASRKTEVFKLQGLVYLSDHKLTTAWKGNTHPTLMAYASGLTVVAGGRLICLSIHGLEIEHTQQYERAIHYISAEPEYRHHPESDMGIDYVRLIVVTTNKVYIHSVAVSYFKSVFRRPSFLLRGVELPISNDNLATPVVMRFGSHLLIEQSGALFKWVDLESHQAKTISLPCFARSRDAGETWSQSRFFEIDNRLFISSRNQLMELLP